MTAIDHPAYRGKYQDACKVTWQGNTILDKVDGYSVTKEPPYDGSGVGAHWRYQTN